MTDEFVTIQFFNLPGEVRENFIDWAVDEHPRSPFTEVVQYQLTDMLYCIDTMYGGLELTFKSPEHYTLFLLRFG